MHVRGVRSLRRPGLIRAGIGTPVAQKGDDLGLEDLARDRYLNVCIHCRIASNSANICWLVKWFPWIAPAGHAATQVPQPWHNSEFTWVRAVRPFSGWAAEGPMALYGHTVQQIRHAEQRRSSTHATSGNTGIAYAMIGANRGYKVKLVLPGNASEERKRILKAYGAEMVFSDPNESSDG